MASHSMIFILVLNHVAWSSAVQADFVSAPVSSSFIDKLSKLLRKTDPDVIAGESLCSGSPQVVERAAGGSLVIHFPPGTRDITWHLQRRQDDMFLGEVIPSDHRLEDSDRAVTSQDVFQINELRCEDSGVITINYTQAGNCSDGDGGESACTHHRTCQFGLLVKSKLFLGVSWTRVFTYFGIGVVAGAATLVIGVPLSVAILGFCVCGILANSVAACCMSCSAGCHGGGVPAGGCVATLQSVGAKGLSCQCLAIFGAVGAVGGGAVGIWLSVELPSPEERQYQEDQDWIQRQLGLVQYQLALEEPKQKLDPEEYKHVLEEPNQQQPGLEEYKPTVEQPNQQYLGLDQMESGLDRQQTEPNQ